ncbi:MAG: carbon starvation protein A, partial [Oligoflexia bacterium]|nr:carbon starvation protein A [Oligoflexia bacterium]
IYGAGMGKFFSILGIPESLGASFGLLALSTFILTTLDTATRLGRYITEELFGMKGKGMRYLSTLVTLVVPSILVMITIKDSAGNVIPAWKAIWPVFGATNQLLAGLALLVIYGWLKKTGRSTKFVLIPVIFMITVTVLALVQLIVRHSLLGLVGIISATLLVIALAMIYETLKIHLAR